MIDKHVSSLSIEASPTTTVPDTTPAATAVSTTVDDKTDVVDAASTHKDIDISGSKLSVSVTDEGIAAPYVSHSTSTDTSINASLSPHTTLACHNTPLFTPPSSPTAARKDGNMRPPKLKRDSSIDVFVEAFGLNRPPTPTPTNTTSATTTMTATAFSSDVALASLTTTPTAGVITDSTAQPYLLRIAVCHDSNATTTTTTSTLTTTDTNANNNGNTVSNDEVDAPLTCLGNTDTSDLTQQSTLLTSRITKHASEHDLTLLKQEYSRMFIESEYIYCSPFTRALETAVVALEGHKALRNNGLILNRYDSRCI